MSLEDDRNMNMEQWCNDPERERLHRRKTCPITNVKFSVRWVGHIACIKELRNSYILDRKSEGKKSLQDL
jgi:hypothetical protein